MLAIKPYLSAGATLADVDRVLGERPHVADYFRRLNADRTNKARIRSTLAREFGDDIAVRLVPRGKPGRPGYEGTFALLSEPARRAVADALGAASIDAVDWTAEAASAAADALVEKYSGNPSSAAMALKNLRAGLMGLLAIAPADARADPRIVATYRPGVTRAHNARAAPRLEARAAAGIDVPPPYERIGDMVLRAQGFVAAPVPSAQAAADLLVILSARPGEAETLRIGDRGGVSGALKKRGRDPDAQYNLVSAVGAELAAAYLDAWRAIPPGGKRLAMAGLARLVATWGVQRRDLRAVGAALAVRAEALEGRAGNEGLARAAHAAALRHEPAPAGRAAAQDHYLRVNDPLAGLAAGLAELSAEDIAAVRAFIQSRARPACRPAEAPRVYVHGL